VHLLVINNQLISKFTVQPQREKVCLAYGYRTPTARSFSPQPSHCTTAISRLLEYTEYLAKAGRGTCKNRFIASVLVEHNGPVLRPRCIGPGRARTHIRFKVYICAVKLSRFERKRMNATVLPSAT
jgi:hypothetical protein